MLDVQCHLCRRPAGEAESETDREELRFCSDEDECFFRSRLRLRIPFWLALQWKARDVERRAAAVAHRLYKHSEALTDGPPKRMRDDYQDYIDSAQWAEFRDGVLRARGFRCEQCGGWGWDRELHHLTYERLGRELPEDVVVLCPPCHTVVTAETFIAKKGWQL